MIEYSYYEGGIILFIMDWISASINLLALAGILVFSIKHLIQKKIDSYFNTKLEDHKKDLAVLTENAKYDISKKLYDFEAYASKKHSVYPELYSLAFESWSELTQFTYRFDEDIMDLRKDLNVETLESYFDEEFRKTTKTLFKAYDYLYKNELYLSKDVTMVYNEALEAQLKCGREVGISFRGNLDDVERQRNDCQFSPLINIDEAYLYDAEEKVRILKETIYKELSYTHFEESKKKEEALS